MPFPMQHLLNIKTYPGTHVIVAVLLVLLDEKVL